MPSHRTRRVAEAVREVVSSAILFEMNDPRIKGVTVLNVEVAGDLREAWVDVTVMGTPGEQKRALNGLQHAAGFLQSRIATRLQTRYTPHLRFRLDDSVKKSIAMSKLIDATLAEDEHSRVDVSGSSKHESEADLSDQDEQHQDEQHQDEQLGDEQHGDEQHQDEQHGDEEHRHEQHEDEEEA